ncbi:MAG: hypothetical protein AB2705_15475, partial [Candidatus Thiodiazotropha sp.]
MSSYPFRGNNCATFIFAILFNGGQLLRKEFAPLRANSFLQELTLFDSASLPREENRKSQQLSP